MKTKILFVIDSLRSGGTERQMVELIKGLNKNDYEIHLIVLRKGDEVYEAKLKEMDVKINYAPRKHRYDFTPLFFISNYIKQNQVRIVHAYLALGAFFGVLAAKISSRPVVCSAIRDAGGRGGWKDYLCKNVESVLADAFVANSQAGFKSTFPRMRKNFRVIYNGVDLSRFDVPESEVRALRDELSLERFKHRVGMVATFSAYKDYDTFINAIPEVCAKFPETGFLLVGDGPDRKRIELRIENMKISQHVILTGFRPDVERIYRLMDISVLMTNHRRHAEGISNSLLESMISGVPVIASSGGGTLELVKDGETGFLVPPADQKALAQRIVDLLSNQTMASQIASKARTEAIRRFGLERYVAEHNALYKKLIER